MKAVSAHVVSCCVYVKPIKNYAAHAWHHSIHVLQLGRSSCSSPSTKEIYSYGRDCTNVSIGIGKSQKTLQLIVLTTCNVVPFCAARFFVRQKRFRLGRDYLRWRHFRHAKNGGEWERRWWWFVMPNIFNSDYSHETEYRAQCDQMVRFAFNFGHLQQWNLAQYNKFCCQNRFKILPNPK